MNENTLTLKKGLMLTIFRRTITDVYYVDDLALPANSHVSVEYLLHRLEKSAKGIGLNVKSDKSEFIWFK